MIGQQLGPYRVLTELGAGGMGEVYRARDTRLERDVAIKVLGSAFASDADRVRRFTIEAQATGALNHPNILAVHDVGTHDGVPYLVGELLEGETLRERMDAGRIPLSKAVDLAQQIASGLAAAHAKGITHRDIKPENLFVTTDGRAKILDFGLAKATASAGATADEATRLNSATAAGVVMGTVGYMSPEQVRGEAADARSDIFSFGVVLYELLSGQRPFIGDTAVQTMNAILTEDPPEIVTTSRALPPALERVVRHCLEKKPDERFQSARDLAFALDALSGGSNASTTSAPAMGTVVESKGSPLADLATNRWFPGALVAAGVLGFALSLVWPDAAAESGVVRYSRFAIGPEQETRPAWSPDGLSIAFVKTIDGVPQIVVRSLDSENTQQLTFGDQGSHSPFWWPGSDRIGFIRPSGIWAVSTVGGEPTQLQEGSFHDADLSVDGTLAAWRVVRSDDTITLTVVMASTPEAEFVEYEPAPFKLTQNLTINNLAFSPDGSQLALAAWDMDTNRTVWRLPVPAGRAAPIQLSPPVPIRSVAWLDNHRLVMDGTPEGAAESQVWLYDTQADVATQLTSGLVSLQLPTAHEDRLVVTAGDTNYDLVEFPLDGGPVHNVFATSSDERAGMWIAGTQRLVYDTQRSGRREIRVRNVSTGEDRLIVAGSSASRLGGGAPSPDGRNVAYGQVAPAASIWIAPIDGGAPKKITQDDVQEMGVTWSPDSNQVAVYRADATIATLRITQVGSDQVLRDIPLPQDFSGHPAWSPDGQWIAVPLINGIHLIDPEGAKAPRPSTVRGAGALAWSADSRTIYLVGGGGAGTTVIGKLPIDTMEFEVVARFPDVTVGTGSSPSLRLSFNAAGTALLTTSARTDLDLWFIDNFLPPPSRWQRWFGGRR
jgi:serine/threonine protein kinase/Tol biopolymer transport system component